MELKDVILSTLAEMEDDPQDNEVKKESKVEEKPLSTQQREVATNGESELLYLKSIRERLLVLFEGFQSPNNANLEAKIDMTLNFLEYTLATIDARVEKIEKGNRE